PTRKSEVAKRRAPSGTVGKTEAVPMRTLLAVRRLYTTWPLRSAPVWFVNVTLSRQPLLDGTSSCASIVSPLVFGPEVELSSHPRVSSSIAPTTPDRSHEPAD